MNHSPGPWRFLEEGEHELIDGCEPLTICDGKHNDLAEVFSENDSTVHITREQAVANARLIAAAPDLLAALQGLYADQVDYLTLNNLGGMDNHWMKAARAAIAKAVGP